MKTSAVLAALAFSLPLPGLRAAATPAEQAAHPAANFDESKVGAYTLPDPLVLADGRPVRDARTWFGERRPEIIELYRKYIYGRSPGRPEGMTFQVFDEDRHALGGTAIRKQVTINFFGEDQGPKMDVLIYLPAGARAPVPVFLAIAFGPNDRVWPDSAIRLGSAWDHKNRTKVWDAASDRGRSPWPVDRILARGYGLAIMNYEDIDPDFDGGLPYGVRAHYLRPGQPPAPDDWGAIGAWAWGMSRALDYLETDRDVDARRVIAVGHSRLGKTTLWAGAQDTRFAIVIPSCAGQMGGKISRRNYGETVDNMIARFPYQFCRNFQRYAHRWNDLPVDGHMEIALVAPRPLYISCGSLDQWADPRGMFLAAVAAGPVYALLGRQGLGTDRMPPLDTAIMHTIGFSCHTGPHAITPDDWTRFLDFVDLQFK